MQVADLKLGFVTARSAFVDGRVWVDVGVGRLIDTWAKSCRSVHVAMSEEPVLSPLHCHPLHIDSGAFFPMPFLPSVAGGLHKVRGCKRAIERVEEQSDVVIVQLPFASPLALWNAHRPRVYHLCGDISDISRNSSLYGGVKRLPALVVGGLIDKLQHRLLHRPDARVVANGAKLLEYYGSPPGRSTVSATLLEREILSIPRQRAADAPFRVLYVGYIRPEKGIDILLDAFEQLLEHIPKAELMIVGTPSTIDRGMSEIVRQGIVNLAPRAKVQWIQHLDFGPALFQCFADADVLALPSRSEGTPRVLIEARAFGCPVVGSNVGGIPSSIIDEVDGLLVPADNPAALKDAFLRLANDRALRERLITAGVARRRATTIEAFAAGILDEALLLTSSKAA